MTQMLFRSAVIGASVCVPVWPTATVNRLIAGAYPMKKNRNRPTHLRPEVYRAELETALRIHTRSMRYGWGYSLPVKIHVEPAVLIQVEFTPKGVSHKGHRYWVTSTTAGGYRKPQTVARRIADEIIAHRNGCADCEVGLSDTFHHVHLERAALAEQREEEALRQYVATEGKRSRSRRRTRAESAYARR